MNPLLRLFAILVSNSCLIARATDEAELEPDAKLSFKHSYRLGKHIQP
jgi:hypothetical protein